MDNINRRAIMCGNCRTGSIRHCTKMYGEYNVTSPCVYNCKLTKTMAYVDEIECCDYCNYDKCLSSRLIEVSRSHSREHN